MLGCGHCATNSFSVGLWEKILLSQQIVCDILIGFSEDKSIAISCRYPAPSMESINERMLLKDIMLRLSITPYCCLACWFSLSNVRWRITISVFGEHWVLWSSTPTQVSSSRGRWWENKLYQVSRSHCELLCESRLEYFILLEVSCKVIGRIICKMQ